MSELGDYQAWTQTISVYPGAGTGSCPAVSYAALGLAGEAGECAEKVKKWLRGDYDANALRGHLEKELGDVLFYVGRLATEANLNLSEIIKANQVKLEDRRARGVLKGSGDQR